MNKKILAGAVIASAISGIIAPALGQDADAVTKGGRVYQNYCATCHGEEMQNTSGGATFDLRRLRADEQPRFLAALENGKRAMPSWKGVLTDAQKDELWAYIRANANE